jgi:D-aminopeptidase
MGRARMRDLGIVVGEMPTGPHNAITDVPGVLVGHRTLVWDTPRVARTGVTLIIPRDGAVWRDHVFAAHHSFNGNGEMTGLLWLEESGVLDGPIGITNTHAVGVVRDALVAHGVRHGYVKGFTLPVVAETYDGWLNDIDAFHVAAGHVEEAIAAAQAGPVPEGNVGGGTGMRCHGFKGGIGTSSRLVASGAKTYVVGALVQANYGAMRHLRVNGVPVGRKLAARAQGPEPRGSIIVVLGTDAPLLPIQCRRLAKRACVGLARVGGLGFNSSGDIFLAFATGNHVASESSAPQELRWLPHAQLDPFFEGAAEAVEEAILNALAAAETMTGFKGTVQALPLDQLHAIMERHRG